MKKIYIIISFVAIALILIYLLARRFNLFGNMDTLSKRFKYFNIKEFDSRAMATDTGAKYRKKGKDYLVDSAKKNMDLKTLKMLDNARDIIDKEWNRQNPTEKIVFRINSGYRTQVFNDSLSQSVTNSSHIKGMAADINLSGYDDTQIGVVLSALIRVGFNRFGMGETYVHVDSDKSKNQNVAWNYGGNSINIDPFTV